jgi:hypothetical protein
VNSSNVDKYLEQYAQKRLVDQTKKQFRIVSSQRYLQTSLESLSHKLTDATQFGLKLSGEQTINTKDWQANTVYDVPYSNSSQVVTSFWYLAILLTSREFVNQMPKEKLEKLLLFATGSTRVPAGGFANLKHPFSISGISGILGEGSKETNTKRLMRAHTCFSHIELPNYASYEVLVSQVDLAIEYGDSYGLT